MSKWRLVRDGQNGKFGYMNQVGEMLAGGYVFETATPFDEEGYAVVSHKENLYHAFNSNISRFSSNSDNYHISNYYHLYKRFDKDRESRVKAQKLPASTITSLISDRDDPKHQHCISNITIASTVGGIYNEKNAYRVESVIIKDNTKFPPEKGKREVVYYVDKKTGKKISPERYAAKDRQIQFNEHGVGVKVAETGLHSDVWGASERVKLLFTNGKDFEYERVANGQFENGADVNYEAPYMLVDNGFEQALLDTSGTVLIPMQNLKKLELVDNKTISVDGEQLPIFAGCKRVNDELEERKNYSVLSKKMGFRKPKMYALGYNGIAITPYDYLDLEITKDGRIFAIITVIDQCKTRNTRTELEIIDGDVLPKRSTGGFGGRFEGPHTSNEVRGRMKVARGGNIGDVIPGGGLPKFSGENGEFGLF